MTTELHVVLDAKLQGLQTGLRTADQALTRTASRMNRQVAALDGRLETVGRGFGRGFNLSGIQQAGYQIGDFAVQVASGQSAMVAFTQQGSQLLGAFGPWGAVIGAAGAVVGALATAFFNASDDAETLDDRVSDLNDAIAGLRDAAITGGEGLSDLSKKYGVIDEQLVGLIQKQTRLNVLNAQRAASGSVEGAVTTASRALDDRVFFPDGVGLGLEEGSPRQRRREIAAAVYAAEAASSYEDQVRALERLDDLVSREVGISDAPSEALLDLATELNKVQLSLREVEKAGQDAEKALEFQSKPVPELRALADKAIEEEEERDIKRRSGSSRTTSPDAEKVAAQIVKFEEMTAALVRQREAIGLTGSELANYNATMDAAAAVMEIENAAREEGIQLSDAQREKIEALRQEYVGLKVSIEEETAAQKQAAEEAQNTERVIGNVARAFTSAVENADDLEDALKRLAARLIEIAAIEFLVPSLTKAFGGQTGTPLPAPSPFSGTYAKGGAFAGGREITAFARGGVVSAPTIFPMARGMGLMGEAGPEAILPLKRGAGGRLGVEAAAANVEVNIHNAPAGTQVRETTTGGGGRRIDVMLDEMTATNIARQGSQTQKAMRAVFGSTPQVTRR